MDLEMTSDVPIPSVKVPISDAAIQFVDRILQDGDAAGNSDEAMLDLPEEGADTFDTPQPDEGDFGFDDIDDIDDYSVSMVPQYIRYM
jgi:hypothetical protein